MNMNCTLLYTKFHQGKMTVLKLTLHAGLHEHTMNTCTAIIKEEAAEWVNCPGKVCSEHLGVRYIAQGHLVSALKTSPGTGPLSNFWLTTCTWTQKPSSSYCYQEMSVGYFIFLQVPHYYFNLKLTQSPVGNPHTWRLFASKPWKMLCILLRIQ